jgi:tRNA(fMet)-specific endonuclease VapC
VILLDTNILSETLRQTPHRKVYARLGVQAGNFAASTISLYELRLGAMRHVDAVSFWRQIETIVRPLARWIEVSEEIALQAPDHEVHLGKRGYTVGGNDCVIAATALVNDWVLVTRNTRAFKHMPGLQLENWFK